MLTHTPLQLVLFVEQDNKIKILDMNQSCGSTFISILILNIFRNIEPQPKNLTFLYKKDCAAQHISTNSLLYKMGKVDTSKCTHYECEPIDIKHMFLDCEYAKDFGIPYASRTGKISAAPNII